MVTEAPRRSLNLLLTALIAAVLFIVTALPAAAVTVTFVRHGESEANASHTIDNSIPGAPLTALGRAQSQALADALAGNGVDYDAIYASNMVRTTQTAAPFAAATGLTPTVLPGFREINAGWFEGWSDAGPGGIGYVLAPALWTIGVRSVPIPGGGDGNAFDARVDAALQVVEESGAQNPVVFSHAATIMFWTMMNVDNPDLGLMLFHRLQNTDVVVVDGSAVDGWTLKSWAGRAVGPATLPTKLLVNLRDLVVTPQQAVYDVARAFRTGDIRQIARALRDGVAAVVRAPVEFATAVVRDVVDAVTRRPADVVPVAGARAVASSDETQSRETVDRRALSVVEADSADDETDTGSTESEMSAGDRDVRDRPSSPMGKDANAPGTDDDVSDEGDGTTNGVTTADGIEDDPTDDQDADDPNTGDDADNDESDPDDSAEKAAA